MVAARRRLRTIERGQRLHNRRSQPVERERVEPGEDLPVEDETIALGGRANPTDLSLVELDELDRLAQAPCVLVVRPEERGRSREALPEAPSLEPPELRARRVADLDDRVASIEDQVGSASTVTATARESLRAAAAGAKRRLHGEEVRDEVGPLGGQHALRVELHALDRMTSVPYAHHLAVLRPGSREELGRHRGCGQRVIAAGLDSVGQPGEDPAPVVSDDARLPMEERPCLCDLPAVRLDDGLVSEADAERRSRRSESSDDLRVSCPRRQAGRDRGRRRAGPARAQLPPRARSRRSGARARRPPSCSSRCTRL